MKAQTGVEVKFDYFFNIGARWDGWSTPRSDGITPDKDPELIVQEVGWAPGPVYTGAEIPASN
jgi:hypothetical protein